MKARVKVRGLAAIDKRTAAARALLDWRTELVADLGGEATLSAQQQGLVELVVRTRLYIDHVDAFLLELPSLITRRRRLLPLVEQRQRLVDSLSRLLNQLGLERRTPPTLTLAEYLAQRYEEADEEDEPEPPEAAEPAADPSSGPAPEPPPEADSGPATGPNGGPPDGE